MDMHNGRPGDVRNFVHKRIIGAIGGGIGSIFSGGNPLAGAISGFVGGGGRGAPVPTVIPQTTIFPGSGRGFSPFAQPCATGFAKNSSGQCVPLRQPRKGGILEDIRAFLPGGQTGRTEFGEAVMGQFGAALEPGFRDSSTAVCPRGTVLGIDRLCYNKGDLKNKERAWPRGRKPLLTGGEMRCISIAAGAAKRLERKQKQLQSMGMLKKPSTSRRRALPSGHHAHVTHDGHSDH